MRFRPEMYRSTIFRLGEGSQYEKLEASYQRTPAHHRKTVSELLELEKARGVHQPGHLKDPSGAVALLWIRRSLSCQYRMYGILLEKRDPVDAAVEATLQRMDAAKDRDGSR